MPSGRILRDPAQVHLFGSRIIDRPTEVAPLEA
jgi:hypothetical protein